MSMYARWASTLRAPLAVALLIGMPLAHAAGIALQNVNYAKSDRKVIVKGMLDGFAGPQTVTLRNLATGAVLGTQTASKSFSFKASIPAGAPVPCEIQVAAGGQVRSAEVRHGPGMCARYTVDLEGLVTDGAIPYATISVTLDGVTYTTTADGNGRYTLPITTANLNQLLKIEAAGTSQTGEPIEFVNLLGSFSRVLDEQTSSGNANANVTNVTTASYVLVLEANGGAEPTTEAELQKAETSVDATELLQLAAIIKLIVDEGYDLPAGETSLLAFISNPVAVASFIETELSTPQAQQDLNAALGQILQDANLVAGFTTADIPSRYYAIPGANPGYLARQGSILEFNAATGAGMYLDFNPVVGDPIGEPFTWLVQNGRLAVTFDVPLSYVGFNSLANSEFFGPLLTDAERNLIVAKNGGNTQIPVRERVFSYTYTRVVDGTQVDTVAVEARRTYNVEPFHLQDGTWFEPSLPPHEEIGSSNQSLRASLDVQARPFAATCPAPNGSVCVPGKWLGNFMYSPGTFNGNVLPEAPYGDVLTFNGDGTVTGTLSSLTAQWAVDGDGALIISYASGWTQKVQVVDTLGIEYGVFNELSKGADRFATYTVNVKASGAFSLTNPYLANGQGKFWQGEINSWFPSTRNADGSRKLSSYFGWQFFPDSAAAVNVGGVTLAACGADGVADDPYASLAFTTWVPKGAGIGIYRGFNNNRVRTWYPIASTVIDGERQFYVMEDERFVSGPAAGQLFFPPRINFLREIDAPWTCSN